MKKHYTFPGEPEEMPAKSDQPEIQQLHDPKEPVFPQKEMEEIPEELPPDENKPFEKPGSNF